MAGAAPGEAAPLALFDLGRIAYRAAWDEQQARVAARLAGGPADDVALVCEHDPVITVGRGTRGADGRAGDQPFLLDDRFEVVEVERGGEATYHGPGQIVIYPIVKLADGRHDLHAWMRALEDAVMAALAGFGLATARVPGATGVWTADGTRKLCSIGVAATRWVTWHGLALNLDPDLSHFAAIRPCGYSAGVMTSVAQQLGAAAPDRKALVARLGVELSSDLAPFRERPAG